ncbi:MAG: glycosyltransferase family 39 protein [Fimbriimonadaceae bacterium]
MPEVSENSPSSRKFWVYALLFALLHGAFALTFAKETPYLMTGRVFNMGGGKDGIATDDIGAPDELQHLIQIGRIYNGEPFPHLVPNDPKIDFYYQGHQTPLFYYAGAGWCKLLGITETPKLAEFIRTHENQELKDLLKKNTFEEIESTREKIQSESLRMRLMSVLLGCITVLGVYALGKWAYSEKIGLWAASFAALLPMNVALSGAISNDPMLICLSTWVVALLIGTMKTTLDWKRAMGIGVLAGLALLTKSSAMGLLPIMAFAFFMFRRETGGEQTKWLRLGSVTLGVALLFGGAWWIRNLQVYGEPLVINTFYEAFKDRTPTAELFIGRVGVTTYWKLFSEVAAQSFVGTFSYMDINLSDLTYKLAWLLFSGVGLIGYAGLKGRGKLANWTLLVTFLVVFGLFVQFNRIFWQPQARYILPAIGPIACLFGAGVNFLAEKSKTFLIPVIWVASMVLMVGSSLDQIKKEFPIRITAGKQNTDTTL